MPEHTIDKKIFGERLKQLLITNNETTYSLANIVRLSPATISRYTAGLMAPKFTTAEAIANYFKVNPLWLMGFQDSIETETCLNKKTEVKNANDISILLKTAIKLLEDSQDELLFDGTPIDGITKERLIESLKTEIKLGTSK